MLGEGLYCGIHLEAFETRVVVVRIEKQTQKLFWEASPFIFEDPEHVEVFWESICKLIDNAHTKAFSKSQRRTQRAAEFKFNSMCLTFSDFDRRYPDQIREFLTTFIVNKLTSSDNGKVYTKEFAAMHVAEACLRSYYLSSDKDKKHPYDAAIFLGFDSGCRTIFASDDREEGVKVTGNTHTDLVGSWLWIGKHAINKMLDEKENSRRNVPQSKPSYSKAKIIENVFLESFKLSSVYEAVNVLHDSYKFELMRFAEKLAREHSEDPLVREVFFDAGVECAKVISKAITSIPYKNRYYRQPLVTSHFKNGERRPLRVLMSFNFNSSLAIIMEGIRHELTHNPTISALEIYWKSDEPALDAAAMAAILDGNTVIRFEPEPLAILTTAENSMDWSDIYRLPAPSNKWKQNDSTSNRSSVDYGLPQTE